MSRIVISVVAVVVLLSTAYVLFADRSNTDMQPESTAMDAADIAVLRQLESQVAELEADLAPLADYQGILDRELQYTRGLDRHDEALIADVFWPDARVSYGSLVSMDELPAWANAGHAENAAHQHFVTTLTVDIADDTAHEEGYIFFSSDMQRDTSMDVRGTPTPGRAVAGSLTTLGTGRYVNRYERRGDEWRLLVHEYVNDISMRMETVDLCATACLGRWDRTDISYMRPLRSLSVEDRRIRAEESRQPRSESAPATDE